MIEYKKYRKKRIKEKWCEKKGEKRNERPLAFKINKFHSLYIDAFQTFNSACLTIDA